MFVTVMEKVLFTTHSGGGLVVCDIGTNCWDTFCFLFEHWIEWLLKCNNDNWNIKELINKTRFSILIIIQTGKYYTTISVY